MNVGWGSTIQPMRAEESPLALLDSELRNSEASVPQEQGGWGEAGQSPQPVSREKLCQTPCLWEPSGSPHLLTPSN